MPFEQKYSPETREAATAKVLERRKADPKDRSVLREVAEEFLVGEQSLRAWVGKVVSKTPASQTGSPETNRTPLAPRTNLPEAKNGTRPDLAEIVPATPARSQTDVANLESEVQKLRGDVLVLKSALAVLLDV